MSGDFHREGGPIAAAVTGAKREGVAGLLIQQRFVQHLAGVTVDDLPLVVAIPVGRA